MENILAGIPDSIKEFWGQIKEHHLRKIMKESSTSSLDRLGGAKYITVSNIASTEEVSEDGAKKKWTVPALLPGQFKQFLLAFESLTSSEDWVVACFCGFAQLAEFYNAAKEGWVPHQDFSKMKLTFMFMVYNLKKKCDRSDSVKLIDEDWMIIT
eukprot:gene30815-38610_t